MVRNLKEPDLLFKRDLYAKLNEQPCRERDLQTATGRSRPTLEAYLFKGIDDQEIEKNPRTRVYSLTDKGRDELRNLDKKASIQKIIDEPSTIVCYDGPVDSLNEIDEYSAIQYFDMLGSLSLPEQMPLPVSVDAGIYASKEVGIFLELAEDWTKTIDHKLRGMGPSAVVDKTVRKMIRTDLVGPFAKSLLWDAIMQRMWALISWHKTFDTYGQDEGMEKPPPFDLDNLLGFDLAITIDYKGKALMQDIEERRKAGKRLVGGILLKIGSGVYEGVSIASTADFVDFFDRAGLLDKSDANKLRGAFRKLGITKTVFRRKRGIGSWTGESSRNPNNPDGRKAVLEVACRYLAEGRVLQMPTGVTAEMLAKVAVDKKLSKRDREQIFGA